MASGRVFSSGTPAERKCGSGGCSGERRSSSTECGTRNVERHTCSHGERASSSSTTSRRKGAGTTRGRRKR
eukprot:12937847-Prorocentrum_lima.AAC.1